ncbi:MAG: hypothetical protein CMF42_01900 [Legionellales bacterium]|nr:hypothetical protein [Legionellales bacterium]|tara:strand:- start:184 stop:1482 length:1299 start_codon:yes stop_codon:yes gene_type:complete
MKKFNTIIIGAGIAGITAGHELKKNNISSIILDKNSSWGGLLDNFTIDGYRFDKFIHMSFAKDKYVNDIFLKTPHYKRIPKIANYYKGFWIKHPAQNNLFPLNNDEKIKILQDFKKRDDNSNKFGNYEDWLRFQYGNYFAENFPMKYTKKYWTVNADMLETKWVGNRMYRPSLKEIEKGCKSSDTPNTYYAKELRYPKKGGYKSFLKNIVKDLNIQQNSNVVSIDLKNKILELSNAQKFKFDNLISSVPLTEIVNIIRNSPRDIVESAKKLNYTSGYLISLGFNRVDIPKDLWFYIYDEDILPARVYSPSLKSVDNVPDGCSSIQAELYTNKGYQFKKSKNEILNNVIKKFIKMGLFKYEDLVVKDIRFEKYANIIFDHHIYENREKVLEYLNENSIISVGRFGEWEYYWSDQSMLSGRDGARKLILNKNYN